MLDLGDLRNPVGALRWRLLEDRGGQNRLAAYRLPHLSVSGWTCLPFPFNNKLLRNFDSMVL